MGVKGGAAGVDIVPGKSAESRLIRLVAGSAEIHAARGRPLTAEQIETAPSLDRRRGRCTAHAAHWSFKTLNRPVVPDVRNRAWPRNPMDNFILARLEREKISPAPEAAKTTLVRRVSLDLTGLPPTPEEAARSSTTTVPTLMNGWSIGFSPRRITARSGPATGSTWRATPIATATKRTVARPCAWRYRHWVIDALNRDLPFDQFTIEQLAGDLLPTPSSTT